MSSHASVAMLLISDVSRTSSSEDPLFSPNYLATDRYAAHHRDRELECARVARTTSTKTRVLTACTQATQAVY